MSTEASSKAAAGGDRSRGDDLQCRGRGGDRAEEMRGAAAKQDGGVLPVVGDDAGVVVVEPCVIAVDDSSIDRALVTALLRRSNYRVTAVDSGKRALEILGSEPNVSMIITDYWMPEMTGYDLLKKVKESSELKQIPVVIMSSENVPTRISRCMEEGAEDFLLKPVRPSDISRITTRMLH
ncbi:two-component response regulator ORR11-like [Panicum virgatum]|uniref:Response regulatory domain-containing protein n=1 Tax=Panicum virgatum TaxID=38727 RepID=A0A8T0VDP8_PANVG|nr:two-component response regulator ORR11-like [Panicum virgatum]KAG2633340.1 hypothetical protein PVAP13_2NG278900 [Panicum virgatum]